MSLSNRRGSIASVFLVFSLLHVSVFAAEKLKSYVVYMGSHSHGRDASLEDLNRVTRTHHAFLGSFIGSEEQAREAIFYSYNKHINGFAARLKEEEAAAIAKHPDVISVFESQAHELRTTHSWSFMSLESTGGKVNSNSAWSLSNFGQDTIIANIDTGVWPESASFSDSGYQPIPERWRGSCHNTTIDPVKCNRKLIGAKYFCKGYEAVVGPLKKEWKTPRDQSGHGSHTLSTAGGNFVDGANVFGLANGTAKGGAPRARVASYKACWPPAANGICFDADMLMAFEEAIYDWVDVLSVSIGKKPVPFFQDSLSIGSFHAMQHGIVTVFAGGNDGPGMGTVENLFPWAITVGAGTMDRQFEAQLQLENPPTNIYLKGLSLTQPLPKRKFYDIIAAELVRTNTSRYNDSQLCMPGTLDPSKVKGKILVCLADPSINRLDQGEAALKYGAVGMVLGSDKIYGNEVYADQHVLPAVHISFDETKYLFQYLTAMTMKNKNPRAYIMDPEAVSLKQAPLVASFSARGPNRLVPQILKPDVLAPGVNIIAAYSGEASATGMPYDHRIVKFNVDSGTSMACPHVAGVAALLKTMYPDWSPAAIKSAIMTSAHTMDSTNHPIMDTATNSPATPFHYGAGHLYPNNAVNPGLVYDMNTEDYLNFLCAQGYNETMLKSFYTTPYQCPDSQSLLDVNYPAIVIPDIRHRVTVSRRLKNVGKPGVYTPSFHLQMEMGVVHVEFEPKALHFRRIGEEKEFKVTFNPQLLIGHGYYTGGIKWSDATHAVTSPVLLGIPAN